MLIARNKSPKMRALTSKRMFQDLVGQKYNRLTVVSFYERTKNGGSKWKCICDCGKVSFVVTSKLRSGTTKSCGCFNKEKSLKHNMSNTRFYRTFKSIKQRCTNPHTSKYHIYGGKGVRCLWKSFEEFREDMYESYGKHVENFGEKETTIDRIDSEGNYSKKNCRWATNLEQARNTKTNTKIFFNGETLCLGDWSDKLGINKKTLSNRLYKGWSTEKAFTFTK